MNNAERREKLFGTDGIRGTPGLYPLTDEMISKVGTGIAGLIVFQRTRAGRNDRARVIIGKDTRVSGNRIEAILADALNRYGIDVLLAGIITTPGLAYLVPGRAAGMGIMISASHNKPTDNGIKFFNRDGLKLSAGEEEAMEESILNGLIRKGKLGKRHSRGKTGPLKGARDEYVAFLLSTVQGHRFTDRRIALDCAHGAASPFAETVLKRLGATVYVIHDTPSGAHINAGGALDTGPLRALSMEKRTDMGIALDGDGDRGILVDGEGMVLNGDVILAVAALALLKQNKLARNTVVGTVMSNLGLKRCIERAGGKLLCTDVGDKYVLATMRKYNLNLGGEQSGHTIFRDYHSSPDGLLTALQVLKIMKERRSSLNRLASCMEKVPQVLVNVQVREKRPFEELCSVHEILQQFTERLKDRGRILLRYSGTEHLARVMVEGQDHSLIKEIAATLAEHIEKEIGVH